MPWWATGRWNVDLEEEPNRGSTVKVQKARRRAISRSEDPKAFHWQKGSVNDPQLKLQVWHARRKTSGKWFNSNGSESAR